MPEFFPEMTPSDLDDFTTGYLECAEFTDCNSDSEEMADAVAFSPAFIESAKADCADFQESNAELLARYCEVSGRDMSHAGHDFWLTRNGHGAGFWDRGNDPCFEELTRASEPYGSVDLYCGDDSLIYGT
jgi:hypothetical protein